MIGDGMGLSHITAGMYNNSNFTALQQFPIVGLIKTHAADDLVTDSAAGATAFACGVKTYNGAIAMNMQGQPVRTIMEEAVNKGYRSGLVVTCSVVHATPACFVAHNEFRNNYEEIASDFIRSGLNFFVGGGKKYFDRRNDSRNLVEVMKKSGIQIGTYLEEDLESIKITSEKFGYFTSDDHPLPALQGRTFLPKASIIGINHLSKPGANGFFMMIEGAQIDWGGHGNNSNYIIAEFLDFDKAIHEVLNWALEDKNTLVIVTADHETGGFALNPGSTMQRINGGFTTTQHTASMVPVFAFGPGSELFSGIYDNTEIYQKMKQALGWSKSN